MRGCFVQWGMRSFAPHGMAHDAIHEINTPMMHPMEPVSYTHLTLPTNREV